MNTQLTLPIEGLPDVKDDCESLTVALENVLELAEMHYKWWYKCPDLSADEFIAKRSIQIVQNHLDLLNDSN